MAYTIVFLIFTAIFSLLGSRPVFAANVDTPTNVPSQIQINQSFSVSSNLTNVQTNEVYFVKCRIGPSSTSLTEGQTYNPTTTNWLYDTNAWVDMPIVTATASTTTFSVQCRVKSAVTEGQKIIYMRACLKKTDGTCGTSFQSSTGTTFTAVTQPSSSPTPTPTPISTPTSTSSSSTFTISNVPSQIDSTESFSVSVNLSLQNSPNTIFYLKGAFKKTDSSNYFGLTKVSGSWIKNNKTYSDQYKITTDGSGLWSGTLEIQPDILDSGYEGSGDYIFKVARYSESGSLSWSNEVIVKINAQEVTALEEKDDGTVLGAEEKIDKQKKYVPSKDKTYSLEKYIKVASPASVAAEVTPKPEVKGEQQTNYLRWFGTIMVMAGIGVLSFVYLRNKSLRERVSNIFRKRD